MSPEQAKGQAATNAAMCGRSARCCTRCLPVDGAFESEDVSDTLAAIIRGGLDWSALPADTPPYVRRVLQQCLQQDRKRRLHDIGDVRLALDQSDEPGAPSIAAPPVDSRPRWPIHLAWLTVLLGVGAAARAGGWLLPAPAPPAETRLNVNTPPTLAGPLHFAISPDGRQVVFNAMSDKHASILWLRPLDRTTARPLVGTEGGTWPFWSPDSRSVGFIAGGKLKRLDLAGGAPPDPG